MNRTYKGFFGGLTNNTRITPYTSFLFLGTSSKSDTKKGVNRGNERIITTTHLYSFISFYGPGFLFSLFPILQAITYVSLQAGFLGRIH